MKKLFAVLLVFACSTTSYAGISCTGVDEGIKEFYLGYSQTKGCYMTVERTDDGGRQVLTNIINAGTPNEKYDCTETIVGNNVITEAKVNYDPAVLEPGEVYPDLTLKAQGGASNFSLTLILVPGEYGWTFTTLNCQQVPDLE